MTRKALHVTFWSDIRHRYGSVQKIMLTLAAAGQDWRHEIACLGEANEAAFEFDGVCCHPFWEHRLKNRVLNKWLGLDAFTYNSIVSLIERVRPDVLHFHNRQDKVDDVLSRLSFRPGVVVHYHRDFPNPVVPQAGDRLLAPSNALASNLALKGLPSDKLSVVPNPLTRDLLDFSVELDREDRPRCRPVVLFGGGNFAHKGVNELLAAYDEINDDCELWLAGSGYERLTLAPNIKVLGELGNREFLKAMAFADIVVVPSHREAFGLVALETMLLRRLLVVSKVGGLAEVVPPDGAIQIIPGSVEELRAGLRRAIELCRAPSNMREQMLERSYTRALEFQPSRIVSRLEAIYADVLAKST